MKNSNKKDEELMVLAHDAVPGYKPVFLVVFIMSSIYIGYILSQNYF